MAETQLPAVAAVQPLQLSVPDEELAALHDRVRATRWAQSLPGVTWDAGTDQGVLRELAAYWAEGFDWRAAEAAINALPNRVVELRGARLHFLHFAAERPGALPLVLTHGWPSSFLELVALAQRLARPSEHGAADAPAFEVVVPSLPGFAFSDQRPQLPADVRTHDLWHLLMTEVLGFDRYGAHGGDLGAGVTSRLGAGYPDAVAGIHVLSVAFPPADRRTDLDADEQRMLAEVAEWDETEGAYGHQQSTRPMTLAPALSDSPVGLLAWMVEKYRAWSDCAGDVFTRFSADDILTQVSLYWFTNTIATSFRPYFEYRLTGAPPVGPVTVPTAVAVFPHDLSRPPRHWAERSYAVSRFTEMPRGGHFAAHEEPDLLADDLRAFFGPLS